MQALALAYGLAGTPPAWTAQIITWYAVGRVAHNAVFLTAPPQPIRAMTYVFGSLVPLFTLAFAALARSN